MSDVRNIETTLKKIFEDKSEVFAWKTDDSVIKQSHIIPQKITKSSLIFTLTPENRILIEDLINEKRSLKLYGQEFGLFLHVKVKSLGQESIEVSRPQDFEFEDRREKDRKDQFQALQVKIYDQMGTFTKCCSDFSAGGFSIVLMKSEKNPIKEIGTIVDVEILGHEIKTHAELIKIDQIKPFEFSSTPYGGKRLAFKFAREDDNLKKRLANLFHSIK